MASHTRALQPFAQRFTPLRTFFVRDSRIFDAFVSFTGIGRWEVMFGMGIWEFLIILVLGVLLIGPEQMPKVARTIGKVLTQFKRATSDLRDAVNKEMHHFEEMEDIKEFKKSIQDEAYTVGSTARDYIEKEIEKDEEGLKDLWGQTDPKLALGDPGILESPGTDKKASDKKSASKSNRTKASSASDSASVSARGGKKTSVTARVSSTTTAPTRRKSPAKKTTS